MTRIEKKPRKNIQYKDLANAVARFDNLEFLTDVVPRTVTFARAIQQKRDTTAPTKTSRKKILRENGEDDDNGEGTSAAAAANVDVAEEDSSDAGSPSETTRLKNLHLSNQGAGKKGRKKAPRDHDGDLEME
ncbi:hypothetical protein ABW21_db0200291 [Orbilia brochopaga]|nr:hypothetical protein ABW21_db0200291 [Drechslerella brochopaga]